MKGICDMKMKLLAILLLAVVVSALGITTARSKSGGRNVVSAPAVSGLQAQEEDPPYPLEEQVPEDPPGTINGAETPELIPDHVAYSLLFDLVANRQTEEEVNHIRSYMEQVGLDAADSDALMAAAQDYYDRVSLLDTQAAEINFRAHPEHLPLSAEEQDELELLENQQQTVVNDVMASLTNSLSAAGAAQMRQHIDERVKRKTKIFPNEVIPRR
jgi:hypothetical protein